MTNPVDTAIDVFHHLHAWVFESWVLPIVRALELTAFSSEAFDGTELFLLGLLQISSLWILIRPLEKYFPAEDIESLQDRRIDWLYTLFHRLGGFALLSFCTLTPFIDALESELRLHGFERWQIEDLLLFLTPNESSATLLQAAWLSFFLYFIVLDFIGYWLHRGQHRINLWWQLHALHHANTRMSLWSDNRNHLLDDLIIAAILALCALFIGVEPEQFIALTMLSKMLQSWQHANVRVLFKRFIWLNRLTDYAGLMLVGPQFHRTHHGISSGNEDFYRGCNFGVVLPWWDFLFATAQLKAPFEATGVSDQLSGRDYGQTLWRQQKLGVLRLFGKA
jgi:sterol desaturase/sphingolipid hydroxylase (fatty acid hydroxylase superfamily)